LQIGVILSSFKPLKEVSLARGEWTRVRNLGNLFIDWLETLHVRQRSFELLASDERVSQEFVNVCPHVGLILEAAVEEVFEGGRDPVWILGWLCCSRNLVEDLENLVFFLVHPRRLLSNHLVNGATEGPNIRESIVP